MECSNLEEKLETETIKASILRHTLQKFPAKIKEEIDGIKMNNFPMEEVNCSRCYCGPEN